MAVVLVADIMPHASLKDALTMTQWTPTVIWMHEKEPRVTFSRKFQTNSLKRDPKKPICSARSRCTSCRPGSTC